MRQLKGKILPKLSVKDLLQKNVGGREDSRPVHELHASDLTKTDPSFCPREIFLMRALDVKRPPQYVQHAMRVTWDAGNDKQSRLNNEYLREYMVGDWECLRCGEQVEWCSYPDIENCAAPSGEHLWRYREPKFKHPSGFTGSLDSVIRFTSAKMRIAEFKIIKGEPTSGSSAPNFKELIAPLAEHRVRTQLYLRLIAEAPDKRTSQLDVSEAHIVYVSRGHGSKCEDGRISPFKEYTIKRDDAAVERYVRMANAVKGGVPEGICASAICKRASVCAVVKDCFSGKYPAVNFWKAGL